MPGTRRYFELAEGGWRHYREAQGSRLCTVNGYRTVASASADGPELGELDRHAR